MAHGYAVQVQFLIDGVASESLQAVSARGAEGYASCLFGQMNVWVVHGGKMTKTETAEKASDAPRLLARFVAGYHARCALMADPIENHAGPGFVPVEPEARIWPPGSWPLITIRAAKLETVDTGKAQTEAMKDVLDLLMRQSKASEPLKPPPPPLKAPEPLKRPPPRD